KITSAPATAAEIILFRLKPALGAELSAEALGGTAPDKFALLRESSESPAVALITATVFCETDAARPESASRLIRFRSARISAADWYRRSRSFSSALPITSSNFGGKSGFSSSGLT